MSSADEPAPRGPLVIHAGDIQRALKTKGLLPRTEFHGEHGAIEDPDIFQPVSLGVTTFSPKLTVKADADGIMLNAATLRTELGLAEVEDLITALTEAREYLEVHGKDA